MWNLKSADLQLQPHFPLVFDSEALAEKISATCEDKTCDNPDVKTIYSFEPLPSVQKYKTKLEELKLANPKYPIYKYFRLLSERTRCNFVVKKNAPKVNPRKATEIKKRKRGRPKRKPAEALDDSIEIVEIADSQIRCSQMGQSVVLSNSTWPEKYKPLKAEAMLGNKATISELSAWLQYWLENNEKTKSSKKHLQRRDDSSSCDSEFDSDSRQSGSATTGNTVMLVGPNGSGKTTAVYALCSEFGINVLELNASSKRTGKKLLQDMQEATQSHQVSKTDALSSFLQGSSEETLENGEKRLEKSEKQIGACEKRSKKGEKQSKKGEKQSKKGEKRLAAKLEKLVKKNEKLLEKSEKNDAKMCLLLVEDIDIVFENQDEGFISALATLLSNSKRPVVLVTSDPKSPHVEKFMNQHSVLKFLKPSPTVLAVWLQVVCLLEGLTVDKDVLVELIEFNKGDVRKTLLQLEFWVRSGGDPCLVDRKPFLDQSLSQSQGSRPDHWFKKPLFDVDECDEDESSNMDWFSLNERDEEVVESKTDERIHVTCVNSLAGAFGGANNLPFPVDLGLVWWNIPNILGLNSVKSDVKEEEKTGGSKDTLERLERIGNVLECLGVADNVFRALDVDSGSEPTPAIWEVPLRDSLEQKEREKCYDCSVSFANDWTHYLLDRCIGNGDGGYGKVYMGAPTYSEKKSRANYQNVSMDLSNAIPTNSFLNRRATTTDYFPTLRTIHRTEEFRSECNTKRRNRFYHYLRSLNISINDATAEIISSTLQM